MSESPQSPAAHTRRPADAFGLSVKVLLYLFIALVALTLVGDHILEVVSLLGMGWLRFLARTLPRISVNGDLLGMTLLCLAGILAVSHQFFRRLMKHLATSLDKSWQWRWRWTWCGAASLGLLFLVGMSVGGIAHQAAWIASSPESWYERKGGYSHWAELKQIRMALALAAMDANDQVQLIQHELKRPANDYYRQRSNEPSFFEKYHCLLILDGERKMAGAILFPRDTQLQRSRNLYYWNGEAEESFQSMNRLPALLKKHEGHLMAL